MFLYLSIVHVNLATFLVAGFIAVDGHFTGTTLAIGTLLTTRETSFQLLHTRNETLVEVCIKLRIELLHLGGCSQVAASFAFAALTSDSVSFSDMTMVFGPF